MKRGWKGLIMRALQPASQNSTNLLLDEKRMERYQQPCPVIIHDIVMAELLDEKRMERRIT
jgi:hypothetical protein